MLSEYAQKKRITDIQNYLYQVVIIAHWFWGILLGAPISRVWSNITRSIQEQENGTYDNIRKKKAIVTFGK